MKFPIRMFGVGVAFSCILTGCGSGVAHDTGRSSSDSPGSKEEAEMSAESIATEFSQEWKSEYQKIQESNSMMLGDGNAFLTDISGDGVPELFFLYDNYKISTVAVFDISGGKPRNIGGFDASSFDDQDLTFWLYQGGDGSIISTKSILYGGAADARDYVTEVFATYADGKLRVDTLASVQYRDGEPTDYWNSAQDSSSISEEEYQNRRNAILGDAALQETILVSQASIIHHFPDGDTLKEYIENLLQKNEKFAPAPAPEAPVSSEAVSSEAVSSEIPSSDTPKPPASQKPAPDPHGIKRAYVAYDSVPDVKEIDLSKDQIQQLVSLLDAQEYTKLKPFVPSNNPGADNYTGVHLVYNDGTENRISLLVNIRDGYRIQGGKGTDELMNFIWNLPELHNWDCAYWYVNSYIDASKRAGRTCTLSYKPTPAGMTPYPALGVTEVTVYPQKSVHFINLTEDQIKTLIPLFQALQYTNIQESSVQYPGSRVVINYTNNTSDQFTLNLEQINQNIVSATQGGDALMDDLWSLDALRQTGLAPQFVNAYIDRQEAQGIPCTLERLPESETKPN